MKVPRREGVRGLEFELKVKPTAFLPERAGMRGEKREEDSWDGGLSN